MEALQEMFPTFPVHTLQQALENSDSVEDAALRLVDIEPLEENNTPPDHAPLGGSSPPAEDFMDVQGQDEDDAVQVSLDKQQTADEDERPKFPGLDDSLAQVVSVFPDVCTDHVKKVYRENVVHQGHNIVDYILDSLIEMGSKYPRTETGNPRKRKRFVEENKYESMDREKPPDGYKSIARRLLQREFPVCPAAYIDRVLQDNFLAQSYAAIVSVYDDPKPPFDRLKNPRKLDDDRDTLSKVYLELVEELKYAKGKAKKQKYNAQLEADAKLAATLDIEEHEENGMMIECQCCYGESPFSGMTQCNEGHLFCLDCARRNAENEVGRGRYRLLCMAGCKSEFPRREIRRFLDEKLILALEKNEQEEVLRMADLEDLTKCPFCDYAAICAPIEEDKEFRCRNPDCLEISCRHCQQKSHIPLTCEEVSKDGKLSIRHKLEEAMTEALVRTCKKCGNKFIKESGCNKMSCSRCRTLQCYVCSETIKGYDHFNDPSRGGSKTNKCPLFDNTDERHDEEVEKAAKLVMEQLKEENPHITDEDLEIKLSEAVKKKNAANPLGMPRMPPAEDPALLGFMPPRLAPPVIPPIHRLIPPAQLVPPRAQPVAHGGHEAQIQGLREQAGELRRNVLQLRALMEGNLAQGRQERIRLQRAGAARQQAPGVLPEIPARLAAGPIAGNPVQPLVGLPVNLVQAAAAQAAQAIPVPYRTRRPVPAPAPAPAPAAAAPPMAPWQLQHPAPIQGNRPATRSARLQELQQRYPAFHFADQNFPMLFYGPDQAAAAGDFQAAAAAAAAPGGFPAAAAGQNTAPNQPAAGGSPPVGWSRRRKT